jgi:hypothetical protein
VDVSDAAGQEHRRLTGGIAAADDHHLFRGAKLRLQSRGGVVDSLPFEALVVRDVQLAVAGAGGDHHGAAEHAAAARQRQGVRRGAAVEADHVAGDGELGPELLRLSLRPPGQRLAGDARWEAKVVLDLAARSGLPAGRGPLENYGVEPIGGGVPAAARRRARALDARSSLKCSGRSDG